MKLLAFLLLLFAAFPYIKFFGVGLPSDVQVYALLTSCIILFVSMIINRSIAKSFLQQLYLLMVVVAWLWVLYVEDGGGAYNFLRGIFPYISLFLVTWSMFYVFKYEFLKLLTIEKFLKLSYWLWVMVGVIQIFQSNFLIGWRDRIVISDDRGSISLASEPSYFTITLILISLILILLNAENKKYFYFNIIVSILVAQNAVGVFYSVMVLAIWDFDFKRLSTYFKLILFVLVIAVFTNYMANIENRLGYILNLLMTDPLYLIANDGSLSIRFAHVFIGVKGFVENYFLPNGVTSWGTYYNYNLSQYPELFFNRGTRDLNFHKINSVHASLLYEIGIFSFFLYFKFWGVCRKNNYLIKLFVVLMLMGFNGLNITHPLFSMLVALMIYSSNEGLLTENRKSIIGKEVSG